MFSKSVARAGLIASLAITTVNAIATISVTGSKFFTSDGDQFFVKGKICVYHIPGFLADNFHRCRIPVDRS